jgi:hypothetical protein
VQREIPRGNRSLGDEGPRATLLYWRSREEIGEMLDESEATLIVVGEATLERAIEEQTKRAKKEMKKEVRAQAKEIEKTIDEV